MLNDLAEATKASDGKGIAIVQLCGMGDLDHHPDEYLSVVKLSNATASATWWRG